MTLIGGIFISSIISELFLSNRFTSYFMSSDHQFGLKKGFSCKHPIDCVCNVIETSIDRRLTFCGSGKKAFDRI